MKPMCGFRNFRLVCAVTGLHHQNYVDSCKTPKQKILKLCEFQNKYCKYFYSTGNAAKLSVKTNVTDEILKSKIVEKEEHENASDKSKDEEKKLKMKKYMKRMYIVSAALGAVVFVMLVERWGNFFSIYIYCR